MAEVNNVSEKADKVMDGVESKLSGDNPSKDVDVVSKPLANSHEGKDDNKPNGHEEHGQDNVDNGNKEEDSGKSESKTEDKVEKVEAALTTAAPTADVESKEVKADDGATNEKKEEDESEKTETATKKPAGRGRPAAPKGKRGAAARGKAKETDAGSSNVDDKEEKKQPEAEKKSEEPEKKPEAEKEEETSGEVAKSSPKKPGRKRGAAKEAEPTTTKVAKTDDDGPSGVQQTPSNDKKTPLLETPLVIEGKRQRQKVERLDSKMLAVQPHKEAPELPQGSGTKLVDIPFIEAMITKTQAAELKPLHRLIFGRAGSNHEIRKNLRTFCGFDFAKGSDGYTKKVKQMENWGMKQLKQICEILGLERSGKKEDLQSAILDFLVKPTDSGKKVPQAKKRKSAGGKRKASSSKGRGKKTKETSGDASGTDEGAVSEESEEKDDDDEKDESEPEPPKAKKAKKSPAKKEAATESASTSKKAPRGKAAAKTAKKSPPTDDALKATIKDLLKGANLEEITMRDMCRKVYAKFPDFDLTSRKDYIKDTVKSIISSSTE